MNSKTVTPQDIFILIILIWEELSLKIITENIFNETNFKLFILPLYKKIIIKPLI